MPKLTNRQLIRFTLSRSEAARRDALRGRLMFVHETVDGVTPIDIIKLYKILSKAPLNFSSYQRTAIDEYQRLIKTDKSLKIKDTKFDMDDFVNKVEKSTQGCPKGKPCDKSCKSLWTRVLEFFSCRSCK